MRNGESGSSAWKRHRFGLAAIVLLIAVFFAPALTTRQVFSFRDHADYFQPLRYYTSIHLQAFELPYWNPYSQSGEPWLANPQTGVFYPPTWLFAFLPFESAYMLYLAFHLALLGCGAYLLFARQVRPGAALVAAVALMFCGPVMSLLDVSNNLASFAWVPLVIWCALSRVRPELAALVLAMTFLAGEPFFAAIAALLYVVVSFSAAAPLEALSDVAIAGAGALGLSAIQLLPFVEMLRGSDRAAGLGAGQIFAESMRISDWLRVAVPPRFAFADQPLDPHLSQHFIPIVYVGMLVVALALAGSLFILLRPRHGRRAYAGWLLLLAISVVVAAGNHVPFVGDVFTALPLTLFRYPSRVVAFGALAIAAFAAVGWDRLRPDRRWVDLILLLLVVIDVVPRERPLFRIEPFVTNRVVYPAAVGRTAKVARLMNERLTNRSAWLAGYLNLYQRRFDASTAAPVANHEYMRLYETAIGHGRLDLLNFIGIGYLLSDRPVQDMPALASSGRVTVFTSSGAMPAGTFWSAVRPHATAQEALDALIATPRAKVLDVAPALAEFSTPRPSLIAGAALAAVDSRHARVVIDAPVDGVAMITQQDDPGWRVYVDGVEGKKLVAGGVFRAVAVKKGRHEVLWEYRSRALFVGLTMTLITFVALLMSTFVKRSAARKFSS